MSRWTHVNGSIRVNAIRPIGQTIDFNGLFKSCHYESSEAEWKKCNMPKGSEGSLVASLWTNPCLNHVASYTINVFGDLRDFGNEKDVQGIKDWFGKICKDLKCIRQAVLQIDDEFGENSCILTYDGETDEIRMVPIRDKEVRG